VENELVFVFALFYEGEIIPHPEELDGGKIWSFSELEVAKGTGLLTPNFEEEYRRYGEVLRKMQER
jgi:hypothetical protein